jgi:hypothetical protein
MGMRGDGHDGSGQGAGGDQPGGQVSSVQPAVDAILSMQFDAMRV